MPEDPPLIRQWILLRLLCSRRLGLTVKELADEMQVSEKTIRRDLKMFQQIGVPLEETTEEHGRKKWRISPEKNQPGLTFSYDEALALYLGRHLMEPLAGTLFWEAAQRALRKIRATLGTPAIKYAERLREMFYHTSVGASDYSRKADMIDHLMQGIEDRRAVFITYQSLRATEPVTYDVFPYGLAYHRGSLYLVGRAADSNELRHWKVDRMSDAAVTEIPFQRPKDFDLKTHLAGSFGVFHGDEDHRVSIRFSSTVARYVIESRWHASQKLEPAKDGSVVAEFRLANLEEIKRWLLSFGRHAVVIEPAELRAQMLAEASSVVEQYTTYSASEQDTP